MKRCKMWKYWVKEEGKGTRDYMGEARRIRPKNKRIANTFIKMSRSEKGHKKALKRLINLYC